MAGILGYLGGVVVDSWMNVVHCALHANSSPDEHSNPIGGYLNTDLDSADSDAYTTYADAYGHAHTTDRDGDCDTFTADSDTDQHANADAGADVHSPDPN